MPSLFGKTLPKVIGDVFLSVLGSGGTTTAGPAVKIVNGIVSLLISVGESGVLPTALAVDRSGLPTGQTVYWRSTDPSKATVNKTTGAYRGMASGQVSFIAQLTDPIIVVSPLDAILAEPGPYNASLGHTFVIGDDFSSYASGEDMVASPNWFAVNSTKVQDYSTNAAGANHIRTDGPNGSKCASLQYDGKTNVPDASLNEGHAMTIAIPSSAQFGAPGNPGIIRFKVRYVTDVQLDVDPITGVPTGNTIWVKNFLGWSDPGNHWQMNTGGPEGTRQHIPYATAGDDYVATMIGLWNGVQQSTSNCMQATGPWIKDHVGEWLQVAIRYEAGTALNAADSVNQMWLNGVPVVQSRKELIGVPISPTVLSPPTGQPILWCDSVDCSGMYGPEMALTRFEVGGISRQGLGRIGSFPWRVDIADLELYLEA